MEKRSDKRKNVLWMFIASILIILIILDLDKSRQIDSLNAQKDLLFEQTQKNQSKIDSLKLELDTLHTLSWENIEYWIDTLGIDHPEIAMQQVILETGMLSSDICKENHNLFGMKEPRVRKTTALGTKRGHAYYENYIDSIKDYKLWQDEMYDGGNYYSFLSNVGYAEAKHYIASLKNI